jgi:hypothetical protein
LLGDEKQRLGVNVGHPLESGHDGVFRLLGVLLNSRAELGNMPFDILIAAIGRWPYGYYHVLPVPFATLVPHPLSSSLLA